MNYELTYRPFGPKALIIQWPQRIDEDILKDILALENSLNDHLKRDFRIRSTYAEMLIIFDEEINFYSTKLEIESIHRTQKPVELNHNTWKIPVCYSPQLAMDLERYCDDVRLTIPEVVEMHSEKRYEVYFQGFLPGFFYLGGLNPKLHHERKVNPDLQVPSGAVAIGAQQTAVYPSASPGGWHVIGKSPDAIFSMDSPLRKRVQKGDYVQFEPISLKEYHEINNRLNEGDYSYWKL